MIYYLLILNLFAFLTTSDKVTDEVWKVSDSSRMEISGATNVNTFQCLSVNYEGDDVMTKKYTVEVTVPFTVKLL